MKKIVFLLTLLALYSCRETNQSKDMISETNIVHPEVRHIEIKELLNVDRIGIYDTLSVFINRGTDSIFYLYDSSDFAYRGAWGMQGNGPEDFQFPFFLKGADNEDGVICVYDVNAGAFKQMNAGKLIRKEQQATTSAKMPALLIGSPNLHLRNDSCFVGNIDSGEGLYFIYHPDEDKMNWIDFPEDLLPPENGFTIMNMNRMTLNFKSNKVVAAMSYYNLIYLYGADNKLLKTVQLGNQSISPTVVDGYHISGDNLICCRDITSSDEAVYVLEQNIKEKDFEKADNAPSRIVVLDWDLNYVKTYALPHYSLNFAYDKYHDRILYTALNAEGGSDIYCFSVD